MKKIIFYGICLLSSLMFVVSCSKDNEIEENLENQKTTQDLFVSPNIELVNFNVASKTGKTTTVQMLSFPTYQDFSDTYIMLENQMEAHDDAFVAQHDNLTLDELDAMEESTGFVSDQPLLDFEAQYGVNNSLRSNFKIAEEAWLATSDLSLDTDPEKNMYFDDIEQALLNDDEQVMINGEIFDFGSESFSYRITSNFAESLAKINNGEDVSKDKNIESTSKWDSNFCKSWKSKPHFEVFNNGNRRMKLIVTIRAIPFLAKTKAKIVSYKKKNNGNWKKSRRYIGVSLQKNLKANNCSSPGPTGYSSKSIKKRKKRKTTQFDWGIASPPKAQRGQSVFGTYSFNGSSVVMVLDW